MTHSHISRQGPYSDVERDSWMEQELDVSLFQDARLGRRLRALLGQLAQAPGQSIALVCQDWANTKAAYRFLSNERVSEAQILGGLFGVNYLVEPIDWKLITNLPVRSRAEAIEKLDWYAMRWKIETFHKILKSGCHAQDSRLRTAQRLTNLIALFCILSWRIFWLTMINRTAPTAPATLALTLNEVELLDKLRPPPSKRVPHSTPSVASCLIQLARLGGYLARASDPPPGNTVIWRGMARLTDIELGFTLAAGSCG